MFVFLTFVTFLSFEIDPKNIATIDNLMILFKTKDSKKHIEKHIFIFETIHKTQKRVS